MNKCMKEGKNLDIDGFYSRQSFNSVQFGDFKLQDIKAVPMPKVAVIMPVYNGSEYLKEAIQSIINQTYMNLVLIIVNDGSTEPEVAEIISKYQPYSEIIIKHLEQN